MESLARPFFFGGLNLFLLSIQHLSKIPLGLRPKKKKPEEKRKHNPRSWSASEREKRNMADRRRPQLTIDTERRILTELNSRSTPGAETYLSKHRERRLKRGSSYLRQCVCIFATCLGGVLVAPQYSHVYYVCWFFTYLSFFCMLPSVLPTDNTKISWLLTIGAGNAVLAMLATLSLAWKKYGQLIARDETLSCRPRSFCVWNVMFWIEQFGMSCAMFVVLSHATYLTPATGLHRFWRSCGFYFLGIGLMSLVNARFTLHAASIDDTYHAPSAWGSFLAVEQLLIGSACLSNKFKMWTWKFAASYSAITERRVLVDDNCNCNPDPGQVEEVKDVVIAESSSSSSSSRSSSSSSRPTHRRSWAAAFDRRLLRDTIWSSCK